MSIKIYEMITDRIVQQLEQGAVPWQKPWQGGGHQKSLQSKKPYRGINQFLLNCAGYEYPYWLTYKQAKARGGQVTKGEKGTPVIFWKFVESKEYKDENGEITRDSYPMLRYYTVFNISQCEGIAVPAADEIKPREFTCIEACKNLVDNWQGPEIEHYGARACYNSGSDTVTMPVPEHFYTDEAYYATLFHELIHSTGHRSRLNRLKPDFFGSHEYSKEELVAEMGSAFLCGIAGIETEKIRENQAAYLASWLTVLKDRKNCKWLVQGAAQAQKAADLIQGIKWENKADKVA